MGRLSARSALQRLAPPAVRAPRPPARPARTPAHAPAAPAAPLAGRAGASRPPARVARAGGGLTSLRLAAMDYHLTDEGAAALGGADAATGAPRLARLRRLDLGQCVRLSGRGLGGLPPGLQELRLGHCVNLKVPLPGSPAPATPPASQAEGGGVPGCSTGGPSPPSRRPLCRPALKAPHVSPRVSGYLNTTNTDYVPCHVTQQATGREQRLAGA